MKFSAGVEEIREAYQTEDLLKRIQGLQKAEGFFAKTNQVYQSLTM